MEQSLGVMIIESSKTFHPSHMAFHRHLKILEMMIKILKMCGTETLHIRDLTEDGQISISSDL